MYLLAYLDQHVLYSTVQVQSCELAKRKQEKEKNKGEQLLQGVQRENMTCAKASLVAWVFRRCWIQPVIRHI